MMIKKRISRWVDTTCRKIKGTLFIRLLAYPYMTARLVQSQKEYQHTVYPEMLRALAGTASNGRCFIIGNGPSLCKGDLEAISSEFSIASNRIYKIFGQTTWRPAIYMEEDADGMKEMLPEVLGMGIDFYIISYKTKDLSIDFGNEKDKVIYGSGVMDDTLLIVTMIKQAIFQRMCQIIFRLGTQLLLVLYSWRYIWALKKSICLG